MPLPEQTQVEGPPRFSLLNRLKISVRNCSVLPSRMRNDQETSNGNQGGRGCVDVLRFNPRFGGRTWSRLPAQIRASDAAGIGNRLVPSEAFAQHHKPARVRMGPHHMYRKTCHARVSATSRWLHQEMKNGSGEDPFRNTTGGSRSNGSCGFSVGRDAIGSSAETSRNSSSPRRSRSAASWLTNPGAARREALVDRRAPASSREFSSRVPRTNRVSPGRMQHSSNFRGESPAMPWRRRKG